ncbi:hypothetical protein [Streptomyces wuyuanensis]|uniref:hypothetical protein n=1 Tax=Streptomyces wuyuanensis TaxID=1196353 RepID=UPI0034158364
MRIGEAIGLRHEDWAVAERELSVVPRLNANGARTKSATSRTIPVSRPEDAGSRRLVNEALTGIPERPGASTGMPASTCCSRATTC